MEILEAAGSSNPDTEAISRSSSVQAWGIAAFTLILVAGLYYAKWQPYYHKAFTAAAKHSIGTSIVAGRAAAPPPASWRAAWEYAFAYGMAIWQAMIVGLLVAAGVQTLLPRHWLVRILGRMSFGSVAVAGAASTASMM
jgi:uncharacterized membrane protein YraQ (UPF0718 family)